MTRLTAMNAKDWIANWRGPILVYVVSLLMLVAYKWISNLSSLVLDLIFQMGAFVVPLLFMIIYVRRVEKVKLWPSLGLSRIPVYRMVLFSLALYFVVTISTWILFMTGEYLNPRLPETVRYDPGALGQAFQGLPDIGSPASSRSTPVPLPGSGCGNARLCSNWCGRSVRNS